jgi:hypothetical protein
MQKAATKWRILLALNLSIGFGINLITSPASAHHSWPVDMSNLVTVTGTVTDFKWENPHPMITLLIKTADGKEETWQIGGSAINRMEAKGWTKTTVMPGDEITGTGYQFRDGQKIIRLEKVTFADGTEIRVYGS